MRDEDLGSNLDPAGRLHGIGDGDPDIGLERRRVVEADRGEAERLGPLRLPGRFEACRKADAEFHATQSHCVSAFFGYHAGTIKKN